MTQKRAQRGTQVGNIRGGCCRTGTGAVVASAAGENELTTQKQRITIKICLYVTQRYVTTAWQNGYILVCINMYQYSCLSRMSPVRVRRNRLILVHGGNGL